MSETSAVLVVLQVKVIALITGCLGVLTILWAVPNIPQFTYVFTRHVTSLSHNHIKADSRALKDHLVQPLMGNRA